MKTPVVKLSCAFRGKVVIFLLLCSVAFAKEDNQRVSIYLHPSTLLLSSYASAVVREPNLFIYFTGEIPFSGYNSVIVNPSLSLLNFHLVNESEILKIGGGVGVRNFLNGKVNGFYLQLMPGAYYKKEKNTYDWGYKSVELSGIYADFLGYIGYSLKYSKVSIFLDAGLGLGYSRLSGTSITYNDDTPSPCANKRIGPAIDINLGIGI